MKIWNEFKEFSMKGNVLDLAIGVIIGNAFGKVVASFVADVIMPPLGMALGKVNFTALKWVFNPANPVTGEKEVALNYGSFLQVVTDFLIITASIFLFVRLITKFKSKLEKAKAEEAPAIVEKPKQELLLEEIRDLLSEIKSK